MSGYMEGEAGDGISSVVKSTHILYLSKNINTAIQNYSITSKSPEFKMYLSKSTKVLVSKCTQSAKSKSAKCLKIAALQAHNASHCDALCLQICYFQIFCTFTFGTLHFDTNTFVLLLKYILNSVRVDRLFSLVLCVQFSTLYR